MGEFLHFSSSFFLISLTVSLLSPVFLVYSQGLPFPTIAVLPPDITVISGFPAAAPQEVMK